MSKDQSNIKQEPMKKHIGSHKWTNDDWGTIAFIIDRREIKHKFVESELRYNCIYFLIGYNAGKELCYVGQAKKRNDGESVLERLREHINSTTENYCDLWDWVAVVTNKNDTWSLDDLNALEHAFYAEIPTERNLNGNNPNSGGADLSNYIDKINQIKSLVNAAGFNLFTDISDKENIQVTSVVDEHSIVEDLQNGMARIPEIVTPHKVVKQMVDMLPAEVWNSKAVFLDPACKGGEYLREVYDRLMNCELLQSEFPNNIERSNHILKNQIYGIALSQLSLNRTTKKLLGEDRNIRIIPNYINKLKGFNLGSRPDGSQKTIQDILNEEFGKTMKIDVVIGNPPYQEDTGAGQAGATALFDKFIDMAINISNIVSMITPTKWTAGNQSNMKYIRKKLTDGDHIRAMVDFMDAGNIFNGTQIAGGVSYFIYDKNYNGKTIFTTVTGNNQYIAERVLSKYDMIPRHALGETIIDKIISMKEDSISKYISKNKWGYPTNYSGNVLKLADDDIKVSAK